MKVNWGIVGGALGVVLIMLFSLGLVAEERRRDLAKTALRRKAPQTERILFKTYHASFERGKEANISQVTRNGKIYTTKYDLNKSRLLGEWAGGEVSGVHERFC